MHQNKGSFMGPGWIKLHRSLLDWQWFGSKNHLIVFINLLLRCNYRETKYKKQTIMPGQILTGRKQISSWTGISEATVYRILCDLEDTNEVNIKKTSKYSIITIVNWCNYQSDEQQTGQQVIHQVNNKRTTNEHILRKKEGKKERINNAHLDFETLYQKYPRKIGKKKGIDICLRKIKTQSDFEKLDQAIKNYSEYCDNHQTDKKFIKHFSTFMGSWEDWIGVSESEILSPAQIREKQISDFFENNGGSFEQRENE